MRVCPSADCDRAESMDGWKTDIRIVQMRLGSINRNQNVGIDGQETCNLFLGAYRYL